MASQQPPAFRKLAARGSGGWRTPPAIFPPLMGLLGLGLAWRRALDAAGLPVALAELLLGAVSLLYLFCLGAYLGKVVQRPGVVAEDFRVLPGRAGLAAATLSGVLFAAVLVPYAPGAAIAVLAVCLTALAALGLKTLHFWATGPAETRAITPVWHLTFVGWILACLSLIPLGYGEGATVILFVTMAVAVGIWAVSLRQLITRIPPAPLRPLLAVHLAPASLFTTVCAMLGLADLATLFAALSAALLVALLLAGRWITQAGFSALWGAFTFPLAACASGWLAAGWTIPGLLLTVAATAVVLPIATRVMQAWAKGGLAAATNAAQS